MSRDMIGDLMAAARIGRTELVRENALALLYKLAGDGDRTARQAIDVIERTDSLTEFSDTRKADSRR